MVLGGGFVGDDLVQLSQLQRCGIVLIIHTHDESGLWLSSCHSSVVVVTAVVTNHTLDRESMKSRSLDFARDDITLKVTDKKNPPKRSMDGASLVS